MGGGSVEVDSPLLEAESGVVVEGGAGACGGGAGVWPVVVVEVV